MKIYVDANAGRDGNGTKEMPFRHINDAAQVAQPGDEVLVAPGVYREFPKVKDTTSIPRGLLLNRYSRRAG